MNPVEFAIQLRDKASSTIDKIGREFSNTDAKAKKLQGTVSGLTGVFGGLKNMLGMVGVGFGFYKVVEMMKTGVEKAHDVHLANAQIEAGLRSTNYAAGMTMDTLNQSVERIKSQTLYGAGQLKSMQSVLLTFPKVGKKIFDPASQSIVDMATRMKMELPHAAIMVGKALQDPATGVMMMRRIGINFTRDQVKGFKALVDAGKLEEAQMLILKELNTEFGGSAKAAFDASPMAQYNKMIGGIQIKLGELAIKVQSKIAPTLIWLAESFKSSIDILSNSVSWIYHLFESGNPILWTAVGAFIAYNAIITIVAIKTKLLAWWTGLSTIAIIANTLVTEGWTAAWIALTVAMESNPIGWIITAIAALIGLVWAGIKYWNKWGAVLFLFMGPLGMIVNTIMIFKNNWDSIVKAFKGEGIIGGLKRIGIVLLDVLLYPVQQLLGLLAKIPGLGKLAGGGEKMIADLRKSLNLADPSSDVKKEAKKIPGTNKTYGGVSPVSGGNTAATKSVASGGTRNNSIYITVGKMVESLVYQGGVGETAQDVEKKFEELLMRVLFAAESAS